MLAIDARATEPEIKAHAIWAVGRVKTFLHDISAGILGQGYTAAPGLTDDGMATLTWAPAARRQFTSEQMRQDLDALAVSLGAKPCAAVLTLAGVIARMMDAAWWTRNLRRATIKANEVVEHAAGAIRRKRQCYASDHAHKLKTERHKANRHTLEGLEVVNEEGQALNLLEVSDGSVSNPKNRRAELMVRARGFEEVAELCGHVAIFLTITCPSRFHRFTGSGLDNQNWAEDTPRDAQGYLCKLWTKIRAAWGRKGYTPYGFRVAEPHHDGCPHWHILLFMPAAVVGWFDPVRMLAGRQDHGAGVVGIAGRYALTDSTAERGAVKHRFTVEHIDTTKGSATGYIAKYISKNIDGMTEAGENVGLDFASGAKASDTAPRVRTWASTWGIRQFQQIGGPSVTVYRELRRLGEPVRGTTPDLFAGPQDAADQGDYGMYWTLQGGPAVKRRMLTLSPAYSEDGTGKYGDTVKRVTGVFGRKFCMQARAVEKTTTDKKGKTKTTCRFELVTAIKKELYLKTKLHTWAVQRAGLAMVNVLQAEHSDQIRTDAAVARFLSEANAFGAGLSAHRAAWTGVNNCTVSQAGEAFNGFDFTGFEPEPIEIGHWLDYSDGIAPWVRDGFIYKQPIFRADPGEVATEVRILDQATQKERESWEHQHKKPIACAR